MAHAPKTKTHLVTAKKLDELYNQPKFQQRLQRCRTERTVVAQDPWLDSQRKKELIRHVDQSTNEEVLVEALYTDHPPGTSIQRIILRLCTDEEAYDLQLT